MGELVNWRVRINFDVEVEYSGSRLKWLGRNNRNREGATSMIREELRSALEQRLSEMSRDGVTRWSVRAPSSKATPV
jgi:hypothetical protein